MRVSGCGRWLIAILWWMVLAFAVAVVGTVAAITGRPAMIDGALTVAVLGVLITPVVVSIQARRLEAAGRGE